MVRTTVQISKDTKWRIVLPEIVRKVENLQPGDYVEIDVKKLEKNLCEFAGCRNPGKLFKNVYEVKDTFLCDLHVHEIERKTEKKLEEVRE